MSMTLKRLCLGLVASSFVVSTAYAEGEVLTTEAAEKLISEKNYICLSCHKVDAQVIGPSFQAIAEKYQGQEGVEEMLVKAVKEGVSGKWKDAGVVAPMPPNNISDEDAKALVQWVLSLKSKEEPKDTATETPKPEK